MANHAAFRITAAILYVSALVATMSCLAARPALAQARTEKTVYSFAGSVAEGAQPHAPVIQASDGNFYGTTVTGGDYNEGTVFKMTPSGAETALYSFTGGDDGSAPFAGLVQASDGNLYGTTNLGGAHDYGTVFRISLSGSETVLHSFSNAGGDGEFPDAGLLQASDGNLYGTTIVGGAYGYGVVFRISLSGSEAVLHSFSNTGADGDGPDAGLIQASDGNLYGTTTFGGEEGYGTVFRISLSGTESVLHSFSYANGDGTFPLAGLVQASDGNLYGTTEYGGEFTYFGAVFRVSLSGSESVVYEFWNAYFYGSYPYSSLIQASDGNLYGTTEQGGTYGYGTVFRISLSGSGAVLRSFSNAPGDGAQPYASLIQALDGNLYGTALGPFGRYTSGNGIVYRVDLSGNYTVLTGFPSPEVDGANPSANLIGASDGNQYGVTEGGGAYGLGAIYKITPSGSETVLYSFAGAGDGVYPDAALLQASDGNLYGTTYEGGAYGYGTVFRLALSGSETVLHSFGANGDGVWPYANLIQAADGNLYGTTEQGGAYLRGTVFRISLSGSEAVLHSFSLGEGVLPLAGLVQASDGNLYGTTYYGGTYGTGDGYGTVFSISLTGSESVIYSFSGANGDGAYPDAGLIQASDGNLYGTTLDGGTYGYGAVFGVSPSGSETVLHSFSNAPGDGAYPYASLIQASDGNLYGTTEYGGVNYDGTVFSVSLSGSEAVLYSFWFANGAGSLYVGLDQASDGDLFGATTLGGAYGCGTVFELCPPSFTITASAGADGSIAPSGEVQVNQGSAQQFTATPSAGYQVYQWTLDGAVVQTEGATYTVADVQASHTLSVSFTQAAPVTITSFGITPATLIGGASATGSLTLSAAVVKATSIKVTSKNAAVTIPEPVIVPAGQDDVTFPIDTAAVPTTVKVTVKAVLGSSSKTCAITVKAPTIAGLSLKPARVKGGTGQTVLTITLSSPAPAAGLLINLASSDSSVLPLSGATVPIGASSVQQTLKPSKVAATEVITISASLNGATKAVKLTVTK